MDFSPILNGCPLFDGVEAGSLSAMLGCLDAREAAYQKGQVILAEGTPAQDVGIVLSGQVQIVRVDYFGNRSIMLNLQPGQLFGEAFACAQIPSLPVSVVAVEDSRVVMLDCRKILTPCCQACGFHSRLIHNLLRVVAEKNLALHQKAEITAHRSTREKLMAYLLLEAKRQNSSRFTIPFDRQGLADYLGVDRSGLSAEISRLKKEGVLDWYKNSFQLLSQECR